MIPARTKEHCQVIFAEGGGPAKACLSLITKCELLNVSQFVLVMGSAGAFFGGSLRPAQAALENGSMSFTVLQPGTLHSRLEQPRVCSIGAMGSVPDSLKDTHNVVIGRGPGKVSMLQVAELVASCCANEGLAENKLLDIRADSSAAKVSYVDLLSNVKPYITKANTFTQCDHHWLCLLRQIRFRG